MCAHEDDVQQDGLQRVVADEAREVLIVDDASVDGEKHYEAAPHRMQNINTHHSRGHFSYISRPPGGLTKLLSLGTCIWALLLGNTAEAKVWTAELTFFGCARRKFVRQIECAPGKGEREVEADERVQGRQQPG